jgi:hypothetical protein
VALYREAGYIAQLQYWGACVMADRASNREEVIGNRCGEEAVSEPITYSLLPITSFKVGDRVTVKSVRATAMLCLRPTEIELAAYPNLIGVELTIESIEHPWVICTRASGSYAPALTAEDLEPYV